MAVATKFGRKPIREHARRFWELSVGKNGTLELPDAYAGLADYLRANIDLIDVDSLARSAIDALDRDLRPKHHPQQLSFFQPDSFIPYGAQVRVRMAFASRQHVMLYRDILRKQFEDQETAFRQADKYLSDRLLAWDTTDATLCDVERRAFGWTDDAAN